MVDCSESYLLGLATETQKAQKMAVTLFSVFLCFCGYYRRQR